MDNRVRRLNGQPDFERILEQDGYIYVPMRIFAVGALPLVLGVSLWRCQNMACTGTIKKIGRFVKVKTPHNVCIQNTIAARRVQVAKSLERPNHVAKPGPKRVKPKTLLPLFTIPEDQVVVHSHGHDANGNKLKLKKILVKNHEPKKLGFQTFVVSYYGIPEPAIVPMYFAHKEWPQDVLEYERRVALYGPLQGPLNPNYRPATATNNFRRNYSL